MFEYEDELEQFEPGLCEHGYKKENCHECKHLNESKKNDVKMSWKGWQHIYPLNDIIEHKTDFLTEQDEPICQCNPKLDFDYKLIIHESIDRRECFE